MVNNTPKLSANKVFGDYLPAAEGFWGIAGCTPSTESQCAVVTRSGVNSQYLDDFTFKDDEPYQYNWFPEEPVGAERWWFW